ncbi:MAG: hypothetical protein K2K94_08445 [Muribaculaceae bacterium]|nr:hypothetical protein [Muribaculaceae bacterium]
MKSDNDTVSIPLSIPLLELTNDTTLLIVAADLYPYFEQLSPNNPKVIKASRNDDGSAYFYRLITPAEYGAIETNDIKALERIIGFVVFENIFVLLDESFSSITKESGQIFDFMLCVEKCPLEICIYDPWERIYTINDGLAYKLGSELPPEYSKRIAESDKRLLDLMSHHRLPNISIEDKYHIDSRRTKTYIDYTKTPRKAY